METTDCRHDPVDTSALMAIVLNASEPDACIAALEAEDDDLLLSAGTVPEALIVAARRNVGGFRRSG